MTKRFGLAVLATTAALAFANGVIYVLTYSEFLAANSGLSRDLFDRIQKPVDQTEALPSVLAMLLAGTLLTAVIDRVKARTFVAGARSAFLFGCLMVGSVNFGLIATTYYYSYVSGIVDIFVAAATFAAAGGVAALILGRGARTGQ